MTEMKEVIMSNKVKTILPPRRKLAAILSISFVSFFTLFLYTPLDMYLNNPIDFVVSWRFLLPPLLIAFLLCFIGLSAILVLIYHRKMMAGIIALSLLGLMIIVARFVLLLFSTIFIYMLGAAIVAIVAWVLLLKILKDDALTVVILGMWGMVVAAYIQTLFLNNRMVVIMGQQTEYSALSVNNVINALIWITVILAPLCIWLMFKVKKKDFRFEKAFVLSLVIVSGMQVVGLVSTAVSTDLPEGFDENPAYFTYEAAVNFNPDNNILVFVLDTLDVRVINNTFETYPHLWDYLDGFTLYENNTAEHFGTVPSMVSMLTGHHLTPWQNSPDYKPEAWGQHIFIDTLREHGFRTNLYLCLISAFGGNEQIEHRTDNMRMPERVEANTRAIFSTTTRLSLGRLSPYVLKNAWLSDIAPDFGSHFIYIEVTNRHTVFTPIVGIHSDMRFHNFVMFHSDFTADSEESVFSFIFLNGAHANGSRDDPGSNGFHFVEETGELIQGGSRTDVVRGNFETLNAFFNRMKEIGVYDNTTIIITGDHGLRDQIPETVSLFIKPKNSTGPLVVDTTTELSHRYFQASILDAAGLSHNDYGISYFDIINGVVPVPPIRELFVLGRHNEPHAKIEGEYGVWQVVGDANNRENWTFIPRDFDIDPISPIN